MARGRSAIVGRQAELAALAAAFRTEPERGRLVVLHGPAGSGRPALLVAAAGVWRASEPLTVTFDDTHPFGLPALLTAARARYESRGDLRLAESIDQVARLTDAPQRIPQLAAELVTLFTRLRGEAGRPVLLADDAHLPAEAELVLYAARRAGYLVVATAPATAGLLGLADQVIEVSPLSDADVATLTAQAIGEPLDDAVLPALRAALGPLQANPATLLSTIDSLRAVGRLVSVCGRTCLRAPREPIPLPATHPLARRAAALDPIGRDLLNTLASAPFSADELPALAAALDGRLADYGRATDRLIALGLLTADPAGRLAFPAPALAATIAAELGADTLRAHAARIAPRLLRQPGADPILVADLLVAAGPGHPDPAAAAMLTAQAARGAGLDQELRWRRAARWHTTDPAARATLTADLLRDLRAHDRHADAAAIATALLAQQPRAADPAPPGAVLTGTVPTDAVLTGAALAEVIAAAAVHTGDPLTPGQLAALARHELTDHPAVSTARSWFAGEPVDLPADWTTGVPGAYRRLPREYASGHWDRALATARELELTAADTPARHLARCHAADICLERGELKRAEAWLAEVPDLPWFAACHGWAYGGLRVHLGDVPAALRIGWAAYRRATGPLGLDRLLLRLASIAHRTGDPEQAARVLAELDATAERFGGPELTRVTALAHGMLLSDREAALTAGKLAREHGHRVDQARACLIAAELLDDPDSARNRAGLLAEAHRLADRFGAPALRTRARELMRAAGITPPRNRTRRDRFSATELRIVEEILDGRTNRQIAADLGVSEKTVENHVTRLFGKTGCRTRLELVAAYLDGRFDADS